MKNLSCLIVDDELMAREILEEYLKRYGDIQVVGKCKSALECQRFLAKQQVDILLLDIQMPKLNGLELLRSTNKPPKTILTTAYSEYAYESYSLNVIDYLLKPIGYERFKQAIDKVTHHIKLEKSLQQIQLQDFEEQYILVKEGYNHRKIHFKDIYYIQSMREYAAYYTREGRTLQLSPLKQIEVELPKDYFIRIHRSFIVAKHAIKDQVGNSLTLFNGTNLPIGKTYKKRVIKLLFDT